MPYTRTIVCLANSSKHHPSRCIAGKEWVNGRSGLWLRPVAEYNVDEGAISPVVSRLQDGSQPQILDIIDVPLAKAVPHGCQVENHLINNVAWRKTGRLEWAHLDAMVEAPWSLWGSGSSTRGGLNDRLSPVEAAHCNGSLHLVRPTNLRVIVTTTGAAFNNPKKQMRALFSIGMTSYNLKVTDPRYTGRIPQCEEGKEYSLREAILCVSIGEPWNGFHYKLVATIFMPNEL